MNEDTNSTRHLDPDVEPEATEDEAPDVQVTPPPLPVTVPPPLPQDDVVMPPPVPSWAEPVEVEPETVVIIPSAPVEEVAPAAYEAAAFGAADVPSPFDDAEEPGVVIPTPVTPSPVTPEPVRAVGTVVSESPKKKNNTVLIIVIVAAVLLLLCCCCVIMVVALGGPLDDMMQQMDTMWLGGLHLPVLR